MITWCDAVESPQMAHMKEVAVFWFVLAHLITFLVDMVLGGRRSDRDKDLQILMLRHQVRLAQRQRPRPLSMISFYGSSAFSLRQGKAELAVSFRGCLGQQVGAERRHIVTLSALPTCVGYQPHPQRDQQGSRVVATAVAATPLRP